MLDIVGLLLFWRRALKGKQLGARHTSPAPNFTERNEL
jgi:hypothetical protein